MRALLKESMPNIWQLGYNERWQSLIEKRELRELFRKRLTPNMYNAYHEGATHAFSDYITTIKP